MTHSMESSETTPMSRLLQSCTYISKMSDLVRTYFYALCIKISSDWHTKKLCNASTSQRRRTRRRVSARNIMYLNMNHLFIRITMRRIILSLLLHTLASVQAFVIVDSESAPKRYLSFKHRRAPLRTHHCQYGRSDALFPTAAAVSSPSPSSSSSHGRLWAGISVQETNRSAEIEDNGGWGFDVDDEVMAQAGREILDATTISASSFTPKRRKRNETFSYPFSLWCRLTDLLACTRTNCCGSTLQANSISMCAHAGLSMSVVRLFYVTRSGSL